MLPLSIVILTKNEEHNIVRCLHAFEGLTDDIIVVDSGSTDNTIQLAKANHAKVIETIWLGYSVTKNFGNQQTKYDWILSLDADEEINETLKEDLITLFSNGIVSTKAFMIQRKMVYQGVVLNHGSVSNEYRIRLFNKKNASWNQSEVHEDLEFSSNVVIQKLNGFVWHYSYSNQQEHLSRLEKYAQLSAKQMHAQGKKATFIKRIISPAFGFIKNYIFKLGFLDGQAGFQFAKNEMWYVKRKYELLHSLS